MTFQRFLRMVDVVIVTTLLPCSHVAAQYHDERAWEFPKDLRPAMEVRLRQFIAAQTRGEWTVVSQLLGGYRGGFSRHMPYTPAHKACLISQIKMSPMIGFKFSIGESPFSSAILTTPPERRWWALIGEADIRNPSGEVVRERSTVTVYRDGAEWYFTPEYIDDEAWARTHLTSEDIAADQRDRVKLVMASGCPLEIIDLHVFMNPKRLSERHVEFRLRNKTEKRVTAYDFEIGDEERRGSIDVATGALKDAIEPRGVSRKWDEDDVAYTYWCEGAGTMRIEVQSVTFVDGTTWNAPDFPSEAGDPE